MKKQLKSLLIVFPLCFLTAGLTLLCFLLDPEFEPTPFIISSMILGSVWAFFLVPALPYTIIWVKNYFANMNFEQGFRFGYLLGCGWGVLAVLLFLIASPVVGTLWIVQTIKSCKKTEHEPTCNENDVFDI